VNPCGLNPCIQILLRLLRSEQALVAVKYDDESCSYDLWTGNRSTLYGLVVSRCILALFRIAI
jgi:hypothetical protein